MCLITLNWQPGEPIPLRIAANHDEFYARPAAGLHHWPGQRILAGQDLQAGGTWLGLGRGAGSHRLRMAALTNYRDVTSQRADAVSRGQITAGFLNSAFSARDYLAELASTTRLYNPFNLILYDGQELMGFESRHTRAFNLPVGTTSVSNADFNTAWPKLTHLQAAFQQALATQDDEATLQNKLFGLLSDARVAPDDALPQTGLSLEKERILSAAFIRTADYGTRASSVIRVEDDVAHFTERRFDANGLTGETTALMVPSN